MVFDKTFVVNIPKEKEGKLRKWRHYCLDIYSWLQNRHGKWIVDFSEDLDLSIRYNDPP